MNINAKIEQYKEMLNERERLEQRTDVVLNEILDNGFGKTFILNDGREVLFMKRIGRKGFMGNDGIVRQLSKVRGIK